MRSSKSRSRSKQNRPRTLGNIINRVFDSSGPEGKVRGTPQQIIEKYQMLARDAQLSNDRVAAENFLQHAEHYTRLLAEAQREMAAEQEARQQYQQQNGQNQNGNYQNGNRERPQGDRDNRSERQDRGDYRPDYRSDNRPEQQPETGFGPAPDAFEVVGGEEEGGLVDLPEAPRPQQNTRRYDNNRPPRDPQAAPQPRRDDAPRREDRPAAEQQPSRRREPAAPRGEAGGEARPEPQKIDIVVKTEAPAAAEPAAEPVAAAPVEAKPAPRTRTRRPAAPKAAPAEAGAGADKPEAAE